MSDYLTSLTVCHVGLFVYLELADRHGGGQEPAGGPRNGPGQLWPVLPVCVVGSHRELDCGGHPSPGQGRVDGLARFQEMDTVPDRHVSLLLAYPCTKLSQVTLPSILGWK